MRRFLLSTVLTGCALALASGCGTPAAGDQPTNQQKLVVRRGTLRQRVLLTGEIHPVSAVQVNVPRIPQWRVQIQWLVPDGSRVKPGDTLVEFDNTAFASNLEEQRLAVLRAEQALERQQAQNRGSELAAEMEVERSQVTLEKAELDAGVPETLLSQREHDERQLALERARAAHDKALANLEAAHTAAAADLQVAKINLAKARRDVETAERAIADLEVKATRAGIVVIADNPREERKLQVGDTVWVGLPVLSLPDLSQVEVDATLSDVDDGLIAVGMPARCTLDAYPDRPFAGQVTAISPVAKEEAGNSLRRAFSVTVALDNADPERMVPGMSVKVEVDTGDDGDVLLAPRAALDLAAASPRALLAGGEWRDVSLGPCDPLECVVTSGVAEGELLAPAAGAAT